MSNIDNEYVLKSLTTNYEDNEVFKHQKHETLNGIEETLKAMNKDEILFELDLNKLMAFSKLRNTFKDNETEEDNFWNHAIALLFMNTLYEDYFIETKHDLDEERKVLIRDNVEEYKNVESALVDRNDVIEAIKELSLTRPRVHIILRYVNNEDVIEEVLNYMDGDIPIKIYSDAEIPEEKIANKRGVKVYDKDEEGITIDQVVGKSYEKKI